MLNIYEQVDTNRRKSFLIIAFFIAFVSGIGYLIGYLTGNGPSYFLPAFLFSFFSSFFSYYYSDKIALRLAQAQPADSQKYYQLHSIVENLAHLAQIPKPKIYLIPSSGMNAFATGRDPQHAAIAVTQGLIDNLNRTELEGVIGHEIGHIAHRDTLLMTLVSVLVGSLSLLIDFSFRWGWGFGRRDDDEGSGNPIILILGLILIILAPFIAQLIQLAISRRREFYADAYSAKLTRQPSGLINALLKISQNPTLPQATTATAHLFIANPLNDKRWLNKLFATHPPIEERIAALQGLKV